jgi:hypothetical protein
LHVAPHLLEEWARCRTVGVRLLGCELELDGERDQMLLHAFVEVALDPPPLGIGGEDEPLSGRAELIDLEA